MVVKESNFSDILRATEVQKLIGVTNSTFYRYVKNGLPRHIREGQHPYYIKSEVIDWIKSNK